MQHLNGAHARFSFVYFLLMLSSLASVPTNADKEKLLVILLDGCRWDYIDQPMLPGFSDVFEKGVRADYTIPVFPTLSYPNYYTIMTGRFTENHGMMLNYMYNPDNGETFTPSSTPYWWEQAEPLWVTATKRGLRVDMYSWPGCEVPIKGVKPNSCVPYRHKVDTVLFSNHLATAVEKFARNESDIALVYCEQPDLNGHLFGPDSLQVKETVYSLGLAIQGLLNDIDSPARNMQEKINVIILSDHGMAKIKKLIPLENYISKNDIEKTVDRGVVIGIYPTKGKLDEVTNGLMQMPNARVWKKSDIPEEFHMKNNIRTPPILVLADPGYAILNIDGKAIPSPLPSFLDVFIEGNHGYDTKDSDDMRGIFLARGPRFKIGVKIPPIRNQDVYNVMMNLSGLEPLPNNGTWANVAVSLNTP